jgi:thiosulfate/3-mercaptopyruvate sulfurtransferase
MNARSTAPGAAAATPAPASVPSGPLVTAEWVQQNLKNDAVRIFEVSVDTGVYENGHIPGAVHLNWHTELVDTVRRDIAPREAFQGKLRASGVGPDTTIVLYGDHNNWFAAWGAWVFEVYGLGDRVKLLDGGRKLWEDRGLPLDKAEPSFTPSTIEIADRDNSLRARLPDVLDVVENGKDEVLVDIRSPDEYNGKIIAPEGVKELAIRAGHVPGAVNFPWGKAVNEDGTFKAPDVLKTLFKEVGVDGSKPLITYCRIGERSSHTWFALTKILGYKTRNYDGSWTEYGNSVGVPVVNVAGKVWTGK